MERFKRLKTIVYLLIFILVVEIGMLIMMIRPTTFQPWAAIGVIAVVCLYLGVLSLGLIKELNEKNNK